MKQVLLKNSDKVALVDDDKFDFVSQWEWLLVEQDGLFYAVRYENLKAIAMHRAILGTPRGVLTDHKDGDGLNNQFLNLRLCTHAQNMRNRTKKAPASSKFKGIYWNSAKGKWSGQVWLEGKKHYLGYFASETEAARAYDELAAKLHGEFAKLNFG